MMSDRCPIRYQMSGEAHYIDLDEFRHVLSRQDPEAVEGFIRDFSGMSGMFSFYLFPGGPKDLRSDRLTNVKAVKSLRNSLLKTRDALDRVPFVDQALICLDHPVDVLDEMVERLDYVLGHQKRGNPGYDPGLLNQVRVVIETFTKWFPDLAVSDSERSILVKLLTLIFPNKEPVSLVRAHIKAHLPTE